MKTKNTLLALALIVLFGFTKNESADYPKIEKGMIKMTIFYPNTEDATFNMDYYINNHMAMAANLMGDDLKAMMIDKGLSGGAPDSPSPYVAVGYFYFESMEAFQKAMGPISDKLKADVPNYTNIQPVIQFSEVKTVQ
ncbi:EthD family reductase [Muricauda sp. ANG21]|uniref:EthD family reductase n=1 Tax=Allomuricauda sp. ANG21 TaxID=3042468 RepID=UPI00345232B3